MKPKQYQVHFTKWAAKQAERVPVYIAEALRVWVFEVDLYGLPEVRKLPGYHDEPLRGQRSGERSVRLSRGYRVIYKEFESGEVVVVSVQEVTKHGY